MPERTSRRLERKPIVALVTDRHAYAADEDVAAGRLRLAVAAASAAGIDLIQVRERDLDDRRAVVLCRDIVTTASGGAAVVVNRRCDLALASGAAGVHLAASSPASSRVRDVVPPGFLIGRSVHSADEARAAEADGGCNYLIFGTVFASASKARGHPVAGLEGLTAACRAVRLPVLAIGGVTLERLPEVARAGAAGIAAISLFATIDPAESVARSKFAHVVLQIRRAFDSASPAV